MFEKGLQRMHGSSLKETYAKNKAETVLKVLQDKMEAEKDIEILANKSSAVVSMESDKESDDNMSVDGEDGWRQQKRVKNKREWQKSNFKCNICSIKFKKENELLNHIKTCHGNKKEDHLYLCESCDYKSDTENKIKNHLVHKHGFKRDTCEKESKHEKDVNNHKPNEHLNKIPGIKRYNCKICDIEFDYENKLKEHTEGEHSNSRKQLNDRMVYRCRICDNRSETVKELEDHMKCRHGQGDEMPSFSCNKCDKQYYSMDKLRRHDWRSHRQIECNMCGQTIESRHGIREHREKEHGMFKIVYCKFFPNCLDGDECLFEHGKSNDVKGGVEFCAQGKNCNDQSCKFSEQRHLKLKEICKFQSNCNRLNCIYVHTGPRKAFLEEGFLKSIRK